MGRLSRLLPGLLSWALMPPVSEQFAWFGLNGKGAPSRCPEYAGRAVLVRAGQCLCEAVAAIAAAGLGT